ncbi:MAG: helix-turn-helix domain-containing protein [Candidatus Aenigmarchaeota archaeon]|nr:helix-turn-helix domain-containing protein [Candidatus Aenigmarchaeota archaeon]
MNDEKEEAEIYQKALEELLHQLHLCEGEAIRASAKGKGHGYDSPEFGESLAKIGRHRKKINKLCAVLKYEELSGEEAEYEGTDTSLGQYLLKARLRKGYTQREAARMSGLSHASVSTIEEGKYRGINTQTLGKIIRGYGLTRDEALEALRMALREYMP